MITWTFTWNQRRPTWEPATDWKCSMCRKVRGRGTIIINWYGIDIPSPCPRCLDYLRQQAKP